MAGSGQQRGVDTCIHSWKWTSSRAGGRVQARIGCSCGQEKRSGVAEGSSETVGEGEHAVVRGKVEKGAREGRWGREQAKWEEEGGRSGDSGRKGTNIYTPPATKTRLLRCI